MSENIMGSKVKGLYKMLCKDNWSANTVGIIVALLSILIVAWARPWGAVGAVRNWGQWILYGVGMWEEAPSSIFLHSGSVIGIGFIGGAFLSACLGGNFGFHIPPKLEMIKALIAGVFMGAGASLAGGCNVGGFYNAIGNLSAHGFAMMAGLIVGAILGLKYTYWEMENITWGVSGGKSIEFPQAVLNILGILAIGGIVWGVYAYSGAEDEEYLRFAGMLAIAAALGYAFQRGRWCMIQGFREPHMTGDCELAKSVALSIVILAAGIAVLKFKFGILAEEGAEALEGFSQYYVRGTFGLGGILGGILFGFGAIMAGGCGTGTLWRVGEGQIKLWIVTPVFGITAAVLGAWVNNNEWEGSGWLWLGKAIYMPDSFGYGGTLALIFLAMAIWYVVVDWNEDTNKFTLEM